MSFNDLFTKEAEVKKAAKEAKSGDSQTVQTKSRETADDQANKSDD